MNGQAITFDFHNTLAACPAWFELEVRTLPSAFLLWWTRHHEANIAADVLADADTRYRQLRQDIIGHGNELTAEACLETVFAAMQIAVPATEVETGVEEVMCATLDEVVPIPGAVETVRALHAAGIPLGIVSSAVYHPFLEWTLEQFGIQDAFQIVVTSASAGFYKSRPEIFLYAVQALGSEPARTVHVGDSLRFDVGGARKAGMGTVWLRGNGVQPEDDAIVPDLIIETLEAAAPGILSVLDARLSARDGFRA